MKKILIVVALVVVGVAYYIHYLIKTHDQRPLHRYEDIRIPGDLDCASVRWGNFETSTLYIQRVGNRQIQTNKETGAVTEYLVNWERDCEYVLKSEVDKQVLLRIKITAVNLDGYGCYIIAEDYRDDYPNFLTVSRK